jgi:N-acetylmuramoyl-L-alanine amidase
MRRLWLLGVAMLVAAAAVGAYLLLRPTAATGPLVVIDAGHGGTHTGTEENGLREQDVNLQIAQRLRKQLIARGYRVLMTRTTDASVTEKTLPSWLLVTTKGTRHWAFALHRSLSAAQASRSSDLQARADIANAAGADVFVSIHNNSSPDSTVRGSETYAYSGDVPGQALAASVLDAVLARTGAQSRGSHTAGLYVCRWTNMPAVLVECAYLSNPQDAKSAASGSYQDRIAGGVADGIDRWFVSYPLRKAKAQISAPDSASLAVAVSVAGYPRGANSVVILPAETTALGPSAVALAAARKAPLLLASASGISSPTASELRRLKPESVTVLGVSATSDLEAIRASVSVVVGAQTRVEVVGGKNARAASLAAAKLIPLPASGTVTIADADDTDAHTALAENSGPVLLSQRGEIDAESSGWLASNRVRIKRIHAVGCAEQPAEPSGWQITTTRRSGPDRLTAELSSGGDPATGARASGRPVVVDAAHAADVFVAAAEAARRGQPLIQLRDGVLGPYSRNLLQNAAGKVDAFTVLRDAGSIPPVAESALRKSVAP